MFRMRLIAAMAAAVIGMAMLGGPGNALAHQGHEHEETKGRTGNPEMTEKEKLCPVSDEEIDKKTKVTYEYKGIVYALCCTDCLEKFRNDPEKYIEKMNEKKEKPADGHDGKHHDHD